MPVYNFIIPAIHTDEELMVGKPVYFHGKEIGEIIDVKEINNTMKVSIDVKDRFIPGTVKPKVSVDMFNLILVR